ncbi:matrix metalloproteinase-14 isoform X1 [Planococcus citri]|uniref:matrix metalloproteinase-14 isoform X1 n=1 Tax=Planococcus citri TaxID=170843 RepID=UPI0031F8A80E
MFEVNTMERVEKNHFRTRRRRTWYLSLSGTSTMILLIFNVICLSTKITPISAVNDEMTAMLYLSHYGYLSPRVKNPHSGQLMSEETMSRAVTEFQAFAGLNLTGYLDDETMHMMSMPRCGVRDKIGYGGHRSKRYILQGSRWKTKDLTYKVSKYTKQMSKPKMDQTVERAFAMWSDVTPLRFRKVSSGSAHIDIRFETYDHGDSDPFDGPGGTLAHAYFPVYGGDVHFDDSERWTINVGSGTNFFQVAVHEFGHALGLSHSDVKGAVMYPFYGGYDPNFELHPDDVDGIQALYGASERPSTDDDAEGAGSGKPTSTLKPPIMTTPPPNTPSPPTTDGDPELCKDGSFDTIFNSKEGVSYVFKGQNYWKLTEDGVAAGYPKSIGGSWVGLPGNIDAAFTYKNGKTYFFKGSKYWKYDGKKVDGEYPKDINEGFTGIPDNIQGAMVWSGNGKIYFFKGSKFWKFDPAQKPPVKSTYPKPISNWEGIPDDLDDAFQYSNGYTYFFKGGKYYRFNDRTFAVDTTDPPFPRDVGYWWFGCKAQSRSSNVKHKNNDQEESASNYRPTLLDIRRDRTINQTVDITDIILDAESDTGSRPSDVL